MKSQSTITKNHKTTNTNAVDNTIIFDNTLPKTAINLFCILVSLRGDNTNVASISVNQLDTKVMRTQYFHAKKIAAGLFIRQPVYSWYTNVTSKRINKRSDYTR